MEQMLDRLRYEYSERLNHMYSAVRELGQAMETGSYKKTYDAGQWLEVNARQLATIAQSIAKVKKEAGL